MKQIEIDKFKKQWTNKLVELFWYKLREKPNNLFLTFMFDFCSLNSEIKNDEFGQLFLCYNYEKTNDSENNILLQNIFSEIFKDNKNEKYIGYYKLQNNNDFRDVLMALFILGNDIEDTNLKQYLLQGNVKNFLSSFQKTGLDSDKLLDNYINDIINEFEIVSTRTKDSIFENAALLKNSEKFNNFPFLK